MSDEPETNLGEAERCLHPATLEAIEGFRDALVIKAYGAEPTHGFSDDWLTDLWEAKCQSDLLAHVRKGDPRDVAMYAMFCWARGWQTFPQLEYPREGGLVRLARPPAPVCGTAESGLQPSAVGASLAAPTPSRSA